MVSVGTKDLYCGAYILSNGGTLAEVRVDGSRCGKPAVTFIFTGEDVEEMLKEYESGQAMTNAAHYKAAMNHLKDVMFERLRTREEKVYGNRQAL